MQDQPLSGSSSPAASIPAGRTAEYAPGEIRLSFGLFYIVLKWGQERRSGERIDQDRRNFPVLTATNVPVLISIWAALFMLLYMVLQLGLRSMVYLFS